MLDVVTTALEVLAVVLLIVAAGWAAVVVVPGVLAWPAGLTCSALVAVAASRTLLWLGGERA